MSEKKPILPLCMRLDEAEVKIFNAINESAKIIPFYQIEGILTNLLHQVREQADAERDRAASIYEKQLQEYNNAEREGEECKKQ